MNIQSSKAYGRKNYVSPSGSHLTGGLAVEKHCGSGINVGLELRTCYVVSVKTKKKRIPCGALFLKTL
jgi:hypothetical protein